MGKGDRKTKRGKIFKGSYGRTRPHKVAKTSTNVPKKEKGKEKK